MTLVFVCISATNFYPQTYTSEDAVAFLVATGTDEGRTSQIVLWDTTPAPYDSNGVPFSFSVLEALKHPWCSEWETPGR